VAEQRDAKDEWREGGERRAMEKQRERETEADGEHSTIYGRLVVMVISRRERKGCSCQGDGAALGD